MIMHLMYLFFILLGVGCNFAQRYEMSESESWKELEKMTRDRDERYRHELLESDYPHIGEYSKCIKKSKCIYTSGNYLSCMGTILPYAGTSFDLIPQYSSIEMIKEKLSELQALRHIPKCWAFAQLLICSVFMPNCNNDNVYLPTQETCRMAMGPCRAILNHTIWPSFIRCDDTTLFPTGCSDFHEPRDIKFNNTGKCLEPLIPTDNQLALFDDIDGCGMPCNSPLYSSDEHKQIHSFIAWGAGICLAFNFFAVLTFMVDWRSGNKYPALVIFYINCCFMVSCIGWLIQFSTGNREVIICRKDGTLRMGEPSGGNLSCVVVFVMIYYSLVAAMVWFVILTYAWHMSFQALGKIQDKIDKKGAYFHLMAWCIPLMLTVTIMALGEIDGNSVTGICFVGYFNHVVRFCFLLGPLICVLLIGGYFLTRGLITLIQLKIGSQDIISEHASSKIRETIVRMGLFSVFTFTAIFVTTYCHIYEFYHSDEWNQSFKRHMMCRITTKYSDVSDCKMESRPSLAKLQLHLLSHFFAGILMSSWVWTGSTVDIWIRFFRRVFNREKEEPIKLKKHKVIAQAFAKRKTFNNDGRLSISFCNSHVDPVGLNFDLTSVASQPLSSTWAAALPKLVTRRGAVEKLFSSGSVSSNRRNSVDSEIVSIQRRVSVESRRNSVDSQYSVKVEEKKTTMKVASSRNRRDKRRRNFGKSRSHKDGPLFRRGSTTSQESQLGAQILNALTNGCGQNVPAIQMPNMNRRSAFTGHDIPMIMDAKSAGKLFPFLLSDSSGSDENLSSEEKNESSQATREMKSNEIEIDNAPKEEEQEDSDTDADEETKMLENPDEPQERSKSKSSNKSFNHENGRRSMESRRSNKYIIQDETTLKHFLQDSSDIKIQAETEIKDCRKVGGIGDLASNLAPFCQEMGRNQNEALMNAREIATQTSVPLDILEMEELKQSIDKIINNRKKT